MAAKADDLRKAVKILLDIPDIEVMDVMESRDGSYIVTAISTKEGTECHKCGKQVENPYGYGELITIRHLPIFGKDVYIRIRMPKYRCTDCDGNPTTTQRVATPRHSKGASCWHA